jgi:hypothetical protein
MRPASLSNRPACFGAAAVIFAVLFLSFGAGSAAGAEFRFAEPDPPKVEIDIPEAPSAETPLPWMPPSALSEWTFHKTSDSLHPDGNEQQMLWLMNRARANPTQEGVWLATMTDPDVASARNYFGVNLSVLQSAFAAIAAKPPAAFDVRLYNAAKAHSDYLIAMDTQSHDGQLTRVTDSGFKWSSWAGIVYSYSNHTVYGHAGFNIDWGNGPYGMQDPPGHRNAIMSVTGNYTNVGYAVVAESNPSTQVGPQVITGNLCYANTGYANHYNRFLVGTVWVDINGNGQYDPGEGLGGVRVDPDQGGYFAITANSGGYAIPITTSATYTVTFSGGYINSPVTQTVAVGTTSALLDLLYTGGSNLFAAAQIGVFRPGTGAWYLDLNGNAANDDCGGAGCSAFGMNGDLPVAGDWNTDGVAEIGVFRPSTGKWYLDLNGNRQWDGCGVDGCATFGMNGDLPVAGDWNGDGIAQIGVFRPSTGKWYLDLNGNRQWDGCSVDGCITFGMNGDLPVAGDWNGDGIAQIGVFRPSTGKWYLDLNGNRQWDGCSVDGCITFGMNGDLPVAGDWNNDGVAEIGVFRPGTGTWYLDQNANDQWDGCSADGCHTFGTNGDHPVAGMW